MNNTIYDKIPIGIITLNFENIITYTNDFFRIDIIDFNAIIGMNFINELIKNDDRNKIKNTIAAIKNNDITCADIECKLLLISNDNQFPIHKAYTLTIYSDLTQIIICFNKNKNNEHNNTYINASIDFLDYLNNAPIALQMLSDEGRVLWANQTVLDFLGYTIDEYLGKHITEFSCDSQAVLDINFNNLNNGIPLLNYSSCWKTKSGEKRYVVIDSNINKDANGNIKNTRCFIRDDTVRQIQLARSKAEAQHKIAKMNAQDKFLRRIFHEIKTPCNVIIQSLDQNEQNTNNYFVQKNIEKIIKIAKDIEDADIFESGKIMVLKNTKFNILDVFTKVYNECIEQYSSNNNEINKNIVYGNNEKEFLPNEIESDKNCIVRVLSHLLDNALRFTESGIINFKIYSEDEIIFFEIANTSNNFDLEYLERVCQRYWESDNNKMFDNGEGIGIGLNICFNILQCMGSQLEFKNENGINYFYFKINAPICSWTNANKYLKSIKNIEFNNNIDISTVLSNNMWDDVDNLKEHIIPDKDIAEIPKLSITQKCPLGNQLPKRPHILVVDDNTICQKVLCNNLEKFDCTSEVASNGKIACEMVLKNNYDLILMDLRMNIMDGLKASKIIINEYHIKTPIIAFSADTSQSVYDECIKIGLIDFISKPAKQLHIYNVISKYIKL